LDFKYDSSVCVNSLYNKTDSSLKGVSSRPYYPKRNRLDIGEERNFVEFPWSYYDIAGFKMPSGGGPVLRFLGANLILRGLKQSLKRGHTVFYFHPIDISKSKFPQIGKGRPLYWLFKGEMVEKKIRHILNNLKHIKKAPLGECL
jgi:peptidoglycan-N-acetylglucosamine deacetylase